MIQMATCPADHRYV